MVHASNWGEGGYRAFLESDRWRWLSAMVRNRDRRCRACGGRPEVVHHLCYCAGADTDADHLTTLCSKCHELFHANARPACSVCGPSVQVITSEPEPVAVTVAPRRCVDPELDALRLELEATSDSDAEKALLRRFHARAADLYRARSGATSPTQVGDALQLEGLPKP